MDWEVEARRERAEMVSILRRQLDAEADAAGLSTRKPSAAMKPSQYARASSLIAKRSTTHLDSDARAAEHDLLRLHCHAGALESSHYGSGTHTEVVAIACSDAPSSRAAKTRASRPASTLPPSASQVRPHRPVHRDESRTGRLSAPSARAMPAAD